MSQTATDQSDPVAEQAVEALDPTELMRGIRCPECHEDQRFGVQTLMNITMTREGWDCMAHQPEDDAFPGRVLDPMDGFRDEDPIICMNGYCRHLGTFAEFRLGW